MSGPAPFKPMLFKSQLYLHGQPLSHLYTGTILKAVLNVHGRFLPLWEINVLCPNISDVYIFPYKIAKSGSQYIYNTQIHA